MTKNISTKTWEVEASPRATYRGDDLDGSGPPLIVSAVVTGSLSPTAAEDDIIAGGKTTILTLTNDTWVAAGATFDAQRQAIIDEQTAATSPTTGWNNEVRDNEVVTAVVRTSSTVVTITWTAAASYAITATETVTFTAPASALVTSLSDITATPTIDITESSSGLFFTDTFESGDISHTEGGASWVDLVGGEVNTTEPKDGSNAVELFWRGVTGSPPGSSLSELRFDLGAKYSDLWCSYDLFIPSNYFQASGNNKGFLYLWEGAYGSPDGPGMGPNFWPTAPVTGQSATSHYVWGDGLDEHLDIGAPLSVRLSDRGHYQKIVVHYKYATVANDDGVAEIWRINPDTSVDKIYEILDGAWFVSGQTGFDSGYMFGWANGKFDADTKLYIDNVKFSTTALEGRVEGS